MLTKVRPTAAIHTSFAPSFRSILRRQWKSTTTTTTNHTLSWTRLTPKPDPHHGVVPCERSSHGFSALKNGKLLLLHGGEQLARTPLEPNQTTWVAEQQGNNRDDWSWRLISSSNNDEGSTHPPPRVAHAQAVYNDSILYVFGGRDGIEMSERAMGDLWKLDCSQESSETEWTWSLVTPNLDEGDSPPEPRSFHQMLCVGTSLYVFGGCGGQRLADLHRFDILSNTWHTLPASKLLRGRGGANFLTFDSETKVGAVAGFCGEETNDGHVFDLETESWHDRDLTQQLSGLRPRSVCVSANFPSLGVSVIFGGEVDPSEKGHEGAGGFANDVVLLDDTTGQYLGSTTQPAAAAVEESWPEARGWSSGTAIVSDENGERGSLFMYGGLSGDDAVPRRLNDLWRLDIEKV